WVNGGPKGGPSIGIIVGGPEKEDPPALPLEKYLPGGHIKANTWQEVVIPLSDLAANGDPTIVNLVRFLGESADAQPPIYFDGLELTYVQAPSITSAILLRRPE
ncbi:MAG TPA: hypothetical protein VGN15_11390, partial [Ktedonobacteraceae bacterium]|nr:hypothetical protein [Ktedonobacteraceae bacterium]